MQSANKKNNDAADLDTAIAMTGLGKFHIGLVMLLGGCFGSATTDNLGISFVVPDLTCELELSVTDKGLFSGASYLGMVLTGYGWGFASDTYGRRKALILSLGFSWLASFCASLAPVFWLLVFLRFLTGTALAGMMSTVFAYVVEFLPPKERTKYVCWSGIFIGVAFCLIPATAWLILPLTWTLDLGFVVIRSWRILCILNGSYILITFLGMLWLPESPKYLVSVEKHDEAIDVLGKIFSINTGRPQNEYPVHAIRKTVEDIRTVGIEAKDKLHFLSILKTMKDQIVPIFGRKHLYGTILGCVLQFCIISSCNALYLWMPDILNRMIIHNSTNPNSTTTVCAALNIQPASFNATCQSEINPMVYASSLGTGANYCVGYLLIALSSNVVSRRTLLATLQFISGIAAIGLHWATDVTTAGILSTVYMVQSGLCIFLLNSLMSDLYPTYLRSTALCIALAIGRFGASLIGAIIGVLLEKDCTLTILGLGAMSIGSGLLSFLFPKPETTLESVC